MSVTESIGAVVQEWQAAYLFEAYIERISVTQPPVTPTGAEGEYLWQQEEAAAIGMSLSGKMVRLLGHHEGYGFVFPVRRSLSEWERRCRSHHTRWPDHRDRPVCGELAWAIVRDRLPMPAVCDVLGVSIGRADRLLAGSLEFMRMRQEQWLLQTLPSSPHDREMCNQCRREDGLAA